MEKPMVRFFEEERGQGALEYYFFMAVIILLAVFVSNSYLKVLKSEVAYINQTSSSTFDQLATTITSYIRG